jgi:hypothetical protein
MSQSPDAPLAQRQQGAVFVGNRAPRGESLADVLERVLDKGIVIVGDIQVRLLDIELLTIKLRLLVASVDRAREMGINWWEGDPFVSSLDGGEDGNGDRAELQRRVEALEQRAGVDAHEQPAGREGSTTEEAPRDR